MADVLVSKVTTTTGFIYECDDVNEHNHVSCFLFMIVTHAVAEMNVTTCL
jgi:hypothetical protein